MKQDLFNGELSLLENPSPSFYMQINTALGDIYFEESEETVSIVPHLIQWEIAIADPLVKEDTA